MLRYIAGLAGGETVGCFVWPFTPSMMDEAARRCEAVAYMGSMVTGFRSAAFDDRSAQFFEPNSEDEWKIWLDTMPDAWQWARTQKKDKGRVGVLCDRPQGLLMPPANRVELQFCRMTAYPEFAVRFGGWLRGVYVVSDKITVSRREADHDEEL